MININMGDTVFISNSILTIRSWDYIRKNISGIGFYTFLKKMIFYTNFFVEGDLSLTLNLTFNLTLFLDFE